MTPDEIRGVIAIMGEANIARLSDADIAALDEETMRTLTNDLAVVCRRGLEAVLERFILIPKDAPSITVDWAHDAIDGEEYPFVPLVGATCEDKPAGVYYFGGNDE